MRCDICKSDKISNEIRCLHCGAVKLLGIWKKVCATCGNTTDKLYGVPTPDNCKLCHSFSDSEK